jgi:hypothetical protein
MQEAATNLKWGILAGCLALALACGGSREVQAVAIEPEGAAVLVGETLALTATPQAVLGGDPAWEVEETYGGGLLQSQGLHVTYVPPEAAGLYHLVVRVPERGGRILKQTVEIRVLANPTLEPASPRVHPGFTLLFRARMKGLPRDTAVWAVEEADGGEVTPDGRYTAPHRPGMYHLTATSVSDPAVIARATVTVSLD